VIAACAVLSGVMSTAALCYIAPSNFASWHDNPSLVSVASISGPFCAPPSRSRTTLSTRGGGYYRILCLRGATFARL
jgi:hypothetical protein